MEHFLARHANPSELLKLKKALLFILLGKLSAPIKLVYLTTLVFPARFRSRKRKS